jgi:hypothetical protein
MNDNENDRITLSESVDLVYPPAELDADPDILEEYTRFTSFSF